MKIYGINLKMTGKQMTIRYGPDREAYTRLTKQRADIAGNENRTLHSGNAFRRSKCLDLNLILLKFFLIVKLSKNQLQQQSR